MKEDYRDRATPLPFVPDADIRSVTKTAPDRIRFGVPQGKSV